MAKNYKIGLVIEGDGKGGVKAIQATDSALAKLDKQTRTSAKETADLTSKFKGMATKAAGVGAAVAGAAAVAGSFATLLRTDVIREMKNTSDAFDVSVEALSSWSYAADRVGISSDKMADIFKDTGDKLGDFVATGGGEAKDLFENLNIKIEDLIGLKPDEQLIKIAEGLEEVGTNGEKIFYLESLADEASRLLPLLENGAEGLKEMMREAETLGIALDDVDAQMVADAAEQFDKVAGAAEGFANQLTIQVAGAMSEWGDDIVDVIDEWGGMEKIVEDVVDVTVNGIAFVLDGLRRFEILLKTIELGWAEIGKVVANFLTGLEDGIAEILNYVLQPFAKALSKIGEIVALAADNLGDFFGESGEGMKNFAKTVRDGSKELESFGITGEDVGDALDSMKGAADKTRAELEELKKSSPGDEFLEDFRDAQKETRKQAEETVKAKQAADKSAEAIKKQEESLKKATEATKKNAKEASEYQKAWERAVERIDEAFADGWLDLLEGDATDVFDSVLDGFKRMLAEMAHLAFTKPIVLEIQSQIGSLFSGASGFGNLFSGGGVAAPAAGGFDFMSAISGIGSAISGSYGSFFTGAGSMLASLGSTVGLSGLGSFGAGLMSSGGWLASGSLSGALGSIGSIASAGSIMGTIGAAIPVAGIIFGAASLIDSISGGKLFGSDWGYDDSGLNLSYGKGEFSGNNYVTEVKERSLFRGRKWRTEETPLEQSYVDQLNAYFDGMDALILSAADQLGIDEVELERTNTERDWRPGRISRQTYTVKKSIEDYLNEFTSDFELSMKDLSEEDAQRAVQEWTTSITDQMIDTIFGDNLDGLQMTGESLSDTLSRVIGQMNLVDAGFDSINLSLETLARRANMTELAFSDEVVQAAGGSERLTALLSGYQSSFFTEEELLERTAEALGAQVKASLKDLGLSYNDDFRAKFEKASARGLSAEEIVQWLEAGNLIGQFETVSSQLADITGKELKDITDRILNINYKIPEAAKKTFGPLEPREGTIPKQDIIVLDPIEDGIERLNETFKTQTAPVVDLLGQVNSGVGGVDESIKKTLQDFTKEVKEVKLNADTAIKQTADQVKKVSDIISKSQRDTSTQIKDVARLIGSKEPIYTIGPVEPRTLLK